MWAFLVAQLVKKLPASSGDTTDVGSVPGSGRSPEKGNGNTLQYSCLENSMDRGAWQATVHGVTKSWAQLNAHTQIQSCQVQRDNFMKFCILRTLELNKISSVLENGGCLFLGSICTLYFNFLFSFLHPLLS